MLASELKFLAGVADLARIDFGDDGSTTLAADGQRIQAIFQGSYSSGERHLSNSKYPKLPPTAVPAAQLKTLAGHFPDDADVAITLLSKNLRLDGAGMSLQLGIRPGREGLFEPLPQVYRLDTTVEGLLPEVELAQDFTAKSMASPVLGGIRMAAGSGRIVLMASDGISAQIASSVEGQGDFPETIPPAFDLLVGLRLLGSGPVIITRPEEHRGLCLFGTSASFRCIVQSGNWPIERMRKVAEQRERFPVEIPAHIVRAVTASAKTLDAGNEVVLEMVDGQAILRTGASEYGQLRAAVNAVLPDTYKFDVTALALASRISNPVILELAGPLVPIRVASGKRTCYFGTRA